MSFQIGDEVELITDDGYENVHIYKGCVGIIRHFYKHNSEPYSIGVEWEDDVIDGTGHNLCDTIDNDNGWYVRKGDIKLRIVSLENV